MPFLHVAITENSCPESGFFGIHIRGSNISLTSYRLHFMDHSQLNLL